MTDEEIDLEAYRFSESHEWVRVENAIATIGITDHAQEQLGDVVAVELPEVDEVFDADEEVVLLDTVKKTEPVYTPVAGTITAINEELEMEPELINEHPFTEGWMFSLEMDDPDELDELMDAASYRAFIEQES